MNRTQLISAIADKTNRTKAQTEDFLDAYLSTIEETLLGGDTVRLVGFGTYSVKETKERVTRNPATGAKVTVKAGKKPVFKFGKSFTDKFNR